MAGLQGVWIALDYLNTLYVCRSSLQGEYLSSLQVPFGVVFTLWGVCVCVSICVYVHEHGVCIFVHPVFCVLMYVCMYVYAYLCGACVCSVCVYTTTEIKELT